MEGAAVRKFDAGSEGGGDGSEAVGSFPGAEKGLDDGVVVKTATDVGSQAVVAAESLVEVSSGDARTAKVLFNKLRTAHNGEKIRRCAYPESREFGDDVKTLLMDTAVLGNKSIYIFESDGVIVLDVSDPTAFFGSIGFEDEEVAFIERCYLRQSSSDKLGRDSDVSMAALLGIVFDAYNDSSGTLRQRLVKLQGSVPGVTPSVGDFLTGIFGNGKKK